MKKLFLALLLVVASCASSSSQTVKTKYADSMGDVQAAYAQSLMINTVKFQESITVKEVPFDPALESTTEKFWTAGSGVVVGIDKKAGTSTILTAWHVCDRYTVGYTVEGYFSNYEVIEEDQKVLTTNEEELDILDVLHRDKSNDICVVEVKHLFPSFAEVADEMPPKGAFVDVVGAPLGIWGKSLVSMSRGQYFGSTDIQVVLGLTDEDATELKDFSYYGFAGVGGYSGSAIYYKGKLVGIHTAGAGRYEHASYGPSVRAIKKALKKAVY